MKKLLLLTLLFSNLTFAEGKIMAIDLSRALLLSDYAQQKLQGLKTDADYKKLSAQAKTLETELGELQKKGKANGLTWSDQQKQDHVKLMQGKIDQLRGITRQQAVMKQRVEANIEKELAPKVENIVNEIIKEKNIGLLVDSKAVYYRTAEFDITKEVVKRLNAAK